MSIDTPQRILMIEEAKVEGDRQYWSNLICCKRSNCNASYVACIHRWNPSKSDGCKLAPSSISRSICVLVSAGILMTTPTSENTVAAYKKKLRYLPQVIG